MGKVLNRKFSSPVKCEIEIVLEQFTKFWATLRYKMQAGEIEVAQILISDQSAFARWGMTMGYLQTFKNLCNSEVALLRKWGGLVVCRVTKSVVCLNNKNGTHGEFRCNWLFWLWWEGGRKGGRPGGL